MCGIFQTGPLPIEPLPKPFDRRVAFLEAHARRLYAEEPDELRTFVYFTHRLKSVSGCRDDLAHGRPGMITRRGKQRQGLLVPSLRKDDRYIPLTLEDIGRLHRKIRELGREANLMTYPLYAAQAFASTGIPVQQVENGSMPSTVRSRSPMLPRLKSPPPTWQP
jgi:hypothetical protein